MREAGEHSQIRGLSGGSEGPSAERHWWCSIGNRLGSEKVEFDTCQRGDLAGFKRMWGERSPVKQSPKNKGGLHNGERDHFNAFQNLSKAVDLSNSFLLVYLEEGQRDTEWGNGKVDFAPFPTARFQPEASPSCGDENLQAQSFGCYIGIDILIVGST